MKGKKVGEREEVQEGESQRRVEGDVVSGSEVEKTRNE